LQGAVNFSIGKGNGPVHHFHRWWPCLGMHH